MREITTSGIVLGYKPKNEYDRLVNLFTDSFGKIFGTAKFAQKPTSPFVGRLDTSNICKFHLYKSAQGKFTIKQCVMVKTFENIKENVALFSIASAILEIADKLTYQHSGMKKYFLLIYKTLATIDKNIKPYLIYLIFKIKFLHLLGLIPSFKHCMACHKKISLNDIIVWGPENVICANCLENRKAAFAGAVFDKDMLKFINFIANNDYIKSVKIKISNDEIKFLEAFLDEIWRNHNLAEINSEKIIKQFI
ncbi:DNA repair protein RecO [Candidatus Peregrinibacteria bacterium]|nr:DNA repair protein RecO [Candidatus Peregrinibacteria bacterium]